MWADLMTALAIYCGALAVLAATAYYLHWD